MFLWFLVASNVFCRRRSIFSGFYFVSGISKQKKKEPFIEFSCVYSAKLLSIYISPPEIESFFIFEIII